MMAIALQGQECMLVSHLVLSVQSTFLGKWCSEVPNNIYIMRRYSVQHEYHMIVIHQLNKNNLFKY